MTGIVVAPKCTPNRKILSDIAKAGLFSVELYLSEIILDLALMRFLIVDGSINMTATMMFIAIFHLMETLLE